MSVTTTLPASVTLNSVGDTFTESGNTVIGANSGHVIFDYDDSVVSVSYIFLGQPLIIRPGTGFGDRSYSQTVQLTITAIGDGSTSIAITADGTSAATTDVTVGSGVADDDSFLNKRGLTYFWENIDEIKQDKLTAGAGISITNDVISATGGGTADAVDWGNITGSMSNQTDLTTALNAKANMADLATVATSGDYDDLTGKPTIGNATLTIQKNGTSAGTFTANATSNNTINITVPTTAADVSALPASTKYGASIAVSINTTDYKVTTTLKDQDGNTLGTAQVIDLPLESVVVNGSYDSTNKKIVLTLQNGNTIDIPVADLVAGLQSEITSSNMLSSDLVDDTNHTHKFVTAAQITKLNGIATGAEVNQNAFSNVKVGSTTVAADAKTDTLELVAGSNVTLTPDATNDKVTIAATDTTYSDATTSAHGLMSAADKTKLNGIAAGAEVNVQSDWDQTTTTADDYIKNKPTLATVATSGSYNDLSNKPTIPAAQVQSNWTQTTATAVDYIKNKPTLATVATSGSYNDLSNKPTIPTVNNATLTIQKNGTTVKTFTANASSNVTANITVPINVSELTNDAGYITSYTDNKTAQTLTRPTASTTYYPVASASSSTNTADVKKFSGVSLSYSDNEGGTAALMLGQTSFGGSVAGSISLVDSVGAMGYTTITGNGSNSTENHTLNSPNTSGRLVANSSSDAATGSATRPVYADSDGILHATTYTLEKSVPSNAVFTDTTYSDATTSAAGLMSAADKTKLNGIATGAEVNVQSDWNVTNTASDAFIKNKPTLATVATSGSYDDLSDKPTIPAAQVQSNWTQTTTTAVDYIKNKPALSTVATSGSYSDLSNKPTIPTVNNATLTIQKNGANVQTFTANSSSNKTANITVPTNTDILNLIYPVGSIYMSATIATAAAVGTALGGTWVEWGAGRVPVGVDASDADFDTAEETGGEKTHTLTVAEMPDHHHEVYGRTGSTAAGSNCYQGRNWNGTAVITNTGDTGGGDPHNNLQPYITCYMYKRTA